MSFTYDVTTARGKVRLLIADTTAAAYAFEDDEIDYFLDVADDDVRKAAYAAVRTLLADKARRVKYAQISSGGGVVQYSDTAQIAALTALLDRLGAETGENLPTVSSLGGSALPMDCGYVEVTCARGC